MRNGLETKIEPQKAGKARILVVEDEMPVALMMTFLLTRAGFDVTTVPNGMKGIELATTTGFDLITLDVDLPDMKGFAICRELKQRHISHRTPIVFVTGRPYEEDRQRAFELGAVDYIEKPFDATDFISRIHSHAKAKDDPATAIMPQESPI
jgi:DNA-binding response OmpR family regulator